MPAGVGAAADSEDEAPATGSAGGAASDPWSGLLQAGMALLQQITGPARPDGPARPAAAATPRSVVQSLVRRDERTGETYVKLPVPSPEVVDQALRAVSALLEGLRR